MKTYIVTKKGKQTKIMADSIEDAIDVYNSLFVKDSSIELDWAGPMRDIEYLAKKYNCTYKRVGTENGYPVIKFTGTRQNLQKLCKQYGMDKEDFEAFVNDAFENYGSVLSKMKEIEHRYNLFRENQNKYYNKGNVSKSVLEAFKKDSNDIKKLLNVAETRFATYKSEMIKSLDDMYKALTKVNW